MAVLLAGIAAMGVMLSVAMPVWRQAMQREKEEELIFRGNQYARAVGLFQRKNGNAYPPSLDLLVQQKYLRKKYKDPMVEDGEFQLIPAGSMQAGQVGPTMPSSAGGSRTQQLASQFQTQMGSSRTGLQPASGTFQTVVTAIAGVVSKSTAKSIKIYNGRDHYNEWFFVYGSPTGAGGALGPGGRGGRGQGGRGGPGGRGPGGGPGNTQDPGQGGRGRGRGGM